jgi:hypothetical protein
MNVWKFNELDDTVTNPDTGESVPFDDLIRHERVTTGGSAGLWDLDSIELNKYYYYSYNKQTFNLDTHPNPNRQRRTIINITTVDS